MAVYTLITNLRYVHVNGVRIHSSAVLLEASRQICHPQAMRHQVRGFHTEASAPTFDMDVPSTSYSLKDMQGNLFKLSDGELEPTITGLFLQLDGGPELTLEAEDTKAPLDFETFEGSDEVGDRTILQVWAALERKAAKYWSAPNMPRLAWAPVWAVRAKLQLDA